MENDTRQQHLNFLFWWKRAIQTFFSFILCAYLHSWNSLLKFKIFKFISDIFLIFFNIEGKGKKISFGRISIWKNIKLVLFFFRCVYAKTSRFLFFGERWCGVIHSFSDQKCLLTIIISSIPPRSRVLFFLATQANSLMRINLTDRYFKWHVSLRKKWVREKRTPIFKKTKTLLWRRQGKNKRFFLL